MALTYSAKLSVTAGDWKINLLAQPCTIYVAHQGRVRNVATLSWESEAKVCLADARIMCQSKRMYDWINSMLHQLKSVPMLQNRKVAHLIVDGFQILKDVEEGPKEQP